MLLKIIHSPVGDIAGVSLEQFQVGRVYDVGTQVACVFVAEGWAQFIDDRRSADETAPRTSLAAWGRAART
jgi:hypothetical protein